MRAEIISIGQEVLLGQIVDTNVVHISHYLRRIGIQVQWRATVGDNPIDITNALKQAITRADVVIATGGIGPSRDDKTRECLAEALERPLVFQDELFEQIKRYFTSRNREMPPANRKQAFIPQGAIGLENIVGTAPGILVEEKNTIIFVLPGVPAEMKYFMEEEVLPYLRSKLGEGFVHQSRTIGIVGIGESRLTAYVDELIKEGEKPDHPVVTLLPSSENGVITILIDHLGLEEDVKEKLTRVEQAIMANVPNKYIFGIDTSLEKVLIDILKQNKLKILTVEAEATQGSIANRFAQSSQAEDCFTIGLVFPTTKKFLEQFTPVNTFPSRENGEEITKLLQEKYKTDIVLLLLTEKIDERGLHQLKLWIRIEEDFHERDFSIGLTPILRNYIASSALNILRRILLEQ
ncbi:MAG: competence/damage-inducible protein A [Candidatus Hermodarchaeota archaeon]